MLNKLERSQKNLDHKIAKYDKQKEKMIGRMHAGKVVDPVKFQTKDTVADIEVCALKLELQEQDLKKLYSDQGDLKNIE